MTISRLGLGVTLSLLGSPSFGQTVGPMAVPDWAKQHVSISDWSIIEVGAAVVVMAKAVPSSDIPPLRKVWIRFENEPPDQVPTGRGIHFFASAIDLEEVNCATASVRVTEEIRFERQNLQGSQSAETWPKARWEPTFPGDDYSRIVNWACSALSQLR